MNRLQLPPNIPQLIALQSPEGEYHPDLEQVEYLTTDGRLLILNTPDATRLNLFDLQPGETVWICKRVTERRGELPHVDMWLSPATEQDRAARETAIAPEPEPQPVPRRKPARKVREMPSKETPEQPALPFDMQPRGTGTYGPAPRPQNQPHRTAPARIPLNIAFAEVTKFVTAGLQATGEQWNDEAKQAMICTVLIQASRDGFLTLWERPANG